MLRKIFHGPNITTLFASAFSFGVIAMGAFARHAHAADDISELVCEIGRVVNNGIGVLTAVALLVFIWGLVRFIARAESDTGRQEGKKVMIWGVIAIFVMVSLWGVVGFLQQSFLDEYEFEFFIGAENC